MRETNSSGNAGYLTPTTSTLLISLTSKSLSITVIFRCLLPKEHASLRSGKMEQFVAAPPPDTPTLETAPPAYDRRDANRSAAENLMLERLEHINVNMAALSADVGSLARTVHKVDRNLQILRLIVRLDTHRKTPPSHPSASYTPMSTLYCRLRCRPQIKA